MKMKLLTDFGIVFEHDTNIRRWDSQEWPFGYTNDENRSIIRDAENDLFLIPRGYWGNEFESEGKSIANRSIDNPKRILRNVFIHLHSKFHLK